MAKTYYVEDGKYVDADGNEATIEEIIDNEGVIWMEDAGFYVP